jgi:hypothetical protein
MRKPKTPIDPGAIAILDRAISPLEHLNRESIFRECGIEWIHFRKRGKRVEGQVIVDGQTPERIVIWENVGLLLSFTKSDAIIADALGVVLSQPSKGRMSWRRIAQQIIQLAEQDRIEIGDPARLDTEEAINHAHNAAGYPCPQETEQLFPMLMKLREYRRDPRVSDAPPCVFTYGGDVWIHQPTLRLWLSTPGGHNHLYRVSEIHAGLIAAGFVRKQDFRVQFDRVRVRIDLWRGSINTLHAQPEVVEEDAE